MWESEEHARQKAARQRLGLRGRYPYPLKYFWGNGYVWALTYAEALKKIFSLSIAEQIKLKEGAQ